MVQGPNIGDGHDAAHTSTNGIHPTTSEPEPAESFQCSNGSAGDSVGGLDGGVHRLVWRHLLPVHIFLIVISGTIGMGLFGNSGEILDIAGPCGALVAYIVVGICVICIMEGIAEMIGHWPIANAMVEFVKAFVDKDLAIVVGLAYWYAYAISFATLIIAAANLAAFWEWSTVLQDFIFIGGVPIILLVINCLGVLWYGNVEAILGALKITIVVGAFLTMCIINNINTSAPTPNGKIQGTYLADAFQNNEAVASNHGIAVLVAIPIVAYAYIGVEIVAVTAVEAKDPQRSLKYPAKLIAWLTATIYFFSALGFYLNVRWTDPLLPSLPGRIDHGSLTIEPSTNTTKTNSIVVIAVRNAEIPTLPGFLNGCLIIAVLSASNTALYVASRTLYGLTREVDPDDKYWGWISKLSTTTHRRRVPAAALLTSVFAFCWVPFLHLTKSYSDQDLQEIMSGIATVAVVLVWGALCLAFIRYRKWLRKFRRSPHLLEEYPEFNHWAVNNNKLPFTTILGWMQPIPAYIGLIFSILTVFVFATAGWWNGGEKKIDIWSAFVGPVALFVFWLFLKALRYGDNFEWYVKLGDWDQLQIRLDRLTSAIATDGRPVTSNLVETEGAVFEMTRPAQTMPNEDIPGVVLDGRDPDYKDLDVVEGFEGLKVKNLPQVGREETLRYTPSPTANEPSRVYPRGNSQTHTGSPQRQPMPQSTPQVVPGDEIEVEQPRYTSPYMRYHQGNARGSPYNTHIRSHPRSRGGGETDDNVI